jgi:glyoxylase-like metal-dependent hydrolase (beta-lactamase superfamily II)
VCEALGIPLWCGDADADAMEQGTIEKTQPDHPVNRLIHRFWLGPPHPVARRLQEGDEVAGFEVLHVPGHSAGHVAYWRESDRALIVGDVLTTIDTLTGLPGLHEPHAIFTPDPATNRESIRRLAALEPELVCSGHGRPLRDREKLKRFVDGLARD